MSLMYLGQVDVPMSSPFGSHLPHGIALVNLNTQINKLHMMGGSSYDINDVKALNAGRIVVDKGANIKYGKHVSKKDIVDNSVAMIRGTV